MAEDDKPTSAEDAPKGPSQQEQAEQDFAEDRESAEGETQSPGNARGTGTDA